MKFSTLHHKQTRVMTDCDVLVSGQYLNTLHLWITELKNFYLNSVFRTLFDILKYLINLFIDDLKIEQVNH